MKRYPHIAVITIEADGCLVKGEYIEGLKSYLKITGRYEVTNNDNFTKNRDGNELIVKGIFYTKKRNIDGVKEIIINKESKSVICWEDFQAYSVIYV